MEEQLKYCGSERTSRVQTHMTTIKFFFINLVIMYWTLNSIYMQFEYQYPKSSNVSVRACAVIEGDVWIRRNEGNV